MITYKDLEGAERVVQIRSDYPKLSFGNERTALLATHFEEDRSRWPLKLHSKLVRSCTTFEEAMLVFVHYPAKSKMGAYHSYIWVLVLSEFQSQCNEACEVKNTLYGENFEVYDDVVTESGILSAPFQEGLC